MKTKSEFELAVDRAAHALAEQGLLEIDGDTRRLTKRGREWAKACLEAANTGTLASPPENLQ